MVYSIHGYRCSVGNPNPQYTHGKPTQLEFRIQRGFRNWLQIMHCATYCVQGFKILNMEARTWKLIQIEHSQRKMSVEVRVKLECFPENGRWKMGLWEYRSS